MSLILASSSVQRKKILEELGLKFKVTPANIDEHHSGYTQPHAIVRSIAERKAEVVAQKYPNDWIIGSDTIVVLNNGKISLKPKNRDEARSVLKTYQNSYCDVYSGLALVHANLGKMKSGFGRTRILFNDFSNESLQKYLDVGEWKYSSGAMTIEGRGEWIQRIEGEYWNVLGLPVDLLKGYMKELRLI